MEAPSREDLTLRKGRYIFIYIYIYLYVVCAYISVSAGPSLRGAANLRGMLLQHQSCNSLFADLPSAIVIFLSGTLPLAVWGPAIWHW